MSDYLALSPQFQFWLKRACASVWTNALIYLTVATVFTAAWLWWRLMFPDPGSLVRHGRSSALIGHRSYRHATAIPIRYCARRSTIGLIDHTQPRSFP